MAVTGTRLYLKDWKRKMTTNNYTAFAKYYDILMSDVNYEEIAQKINSVVNKHFPDADFLVDLACGTGSLSEELNKLGFSVLGVDISQEMLSVAYDKKVRAGFNMQYVFGDMTKWSLNENKADVIVCMLDSLNHLESFDEIKQTFQNVYNSLVEGGLFILDMNTPYKHKYILSDNVFVYEEDSVYCVWQNEYYSKDNRVDIFLDFFETDDNKNYKRFHEEFSEIACDSHAVKEFAKGKGFKYLESFDGFSDNKINDKSERIFYVFKK